MLVMTSNIMGNSVVSNYLRGGEKVVFNKWGKQGKKTQTCRLGK